MKKAVAFEEIILRRTPPGLLRFSRANHKKVFDNTPAFSAAGTSCFKKANKCSFKDVAPIPLYVAKIVLNPSREYLSSASGNKAPHRAPPPVGRMVLDLCTNLLGPKKIGCQLYVATPQRMDLSGHPRSPYFYMGRVMTNKSNTVHCTIFISFVGGPPLPNCTRS